MMDENQSENRIVPYRKVHRIGDGGARLAESWEQPQTGEEKYQPSLDETMHELGNNLNNLGVAVAVALTPLFEQLVAVVNAPEFYEAMASLRAQPESYVTDAPPDLKALARQRSREDLVRKRHELRQTRGRR